MHTIPTPKQTTASHPSDVLTIQQVAVLFRVDETTVRRWIQRGALEAILLPSLGKRQRYRIRRAAIEHILGEPLPSTLDA